jgi:hypothetical protein
MSVPLLNGISPCALTLITVLNLRRKTVSPLRPLLPSVLTPILATLATNKLQAIFATTLLRRKKDSMLDGKRLIELPDKTVALVKLEFSEEERAIYKMANRKSQYI